MFFLLPDKEKRSLHQGYLVRRRVVALTLVLIWFLLTFLLFLPSYSQIWLSVRDLDEQLSKLSQSIEDIVTPEELNRIKKVNHKLMLTQKIHQSQPTEYIDDLIEAAPAGVILNNFFYTYDSEDGGSKLVVHGRAADGRSLLALVNTLNERSDFLLLNRHQIIEVLAQEVDIDFKLQLEVESKESNN